MYHHLQNKNILVTGAAGFIGANLVRSLIRQGANVHALVKPDTVLWRISGLISDIELHRADMTDGRELQDIILKIKPDTIFHLAFPGGHPLHHHDCIIMMQNSMLATANLLNALMRVDFELLVHIGSSLEYGVSNKPLRESDPIQPSTFRGLAKAVATLQCRLFAQVHRKPVIVLRLFSVYGYWESPMRLVPTAINAFLNNNELNLTLPGYRRDMIFIEDVVEACILAAHSKDAAGEIINIGSGQQYCNEEIVDAIQNLCGTQIPVRTGAYKPRPSDTTHWVADIRKVQQLLGWKPCHTLEKGLEKTIDWFKKNKDVYRYTKKT